MAKSEKKKAPARALKLPSKDKLAAKAKLPGKTKVAGKSKPAGKAKSLISLPIVPPVIDSNAVVLDRLYNVVDSRRDADPTFSHSARLLSRGASKVAQKFGEEAVECLIEAVAGNHDALVAESADVLYHLLVLWVSSGVKPEEVWDELIRREGISGIAEKAARPKPVVIRRSLGTTKIP